MSSKMLKNALCVCVCVFVVLHAFWFTVHSCYCYTWVWVHWCVCAVCVFVFCSVHEDWVRMCSGTYLFKACVLGGFIVVLIWFENVFFVCVWVLQCVSFFQLHDWIWWCVFAWQFLINDTFLCTILLYVMEMNRSNLLWCRHTSLKCLKAFI